MTDVASKSTNNWVRFSHIKHQIIRLKLLSVLGVIVLILPVFYGAVSQVQSQTTPSDRNQESTEQNPLQQRLNTYYQAEQELSVMPEDMPVEFPMIINRHIRLGQISDDTGMSREFAGSEIYAIGFIARDANPQPFTPGNLAEMFRLARSNGGILPRINIIPEAQENLLSLPKELFLQAKKIPVIDLIIRNIRNNRKYVIRKVNVNSVKLAALNAVLDRTLRRNNDRWSQ